MTTRRDRCLAHSTRSKRAALTPLQDDPIMPLWYYLLLLATLGICTLLAIFVGARLKVYLRGPEDANRYDDHMKTVLGSRYPGQIAARERDFESNWTRDAEKVTAA